MINITNNTNTMHKKILSTLLLNPASLRIAMTRAPSGERYCIVSRKDNGEALLIYSSPLLPWYLKWCMPLAVYTDLGLTPCSIVQETIDGEDPDLWIEQNEERFRPAGLDNGEIMTQYSVSDNTIIAVSTTKTCFDTYYSTISSGITPFAVKPPLWDLVVLYSKQIKEPFIVWKCIDNGSILAFSSHGTITKLLTLWIGIEDIKQRPAQVCREIDGYIKNYTDGETTYPLYLLSPEHDTTDLTLSFEYARVKPLPEIESVSERDHELFALAAGENSELNFVPFESFQKVTKEHSLWINTLHVLKMAAVMLICIVALITATTGLQFLIRQSMHESFVALDHTRKTLSAQKARLDSLVAVLAEKAKFIQKESSLTRLFGDLQEVFPEGMWAEEISISETSVTTWNVKVRALCQSSELLNTFNDNLRKTPGISNARVVYSETTKLKNNPKTVLRARVEFNWK